MTFSTEFSAASASASEATAPAADLGGWFLGMDEAGYGPNLGPLVVVATKWNTPVPPQECDFYKLLAEAVAPHSTPAGDRLHIADSKLVNTGRKGFENLERGALTLLNLAGMETESFHRLRLSLAGEPSTADLPPWGQADLSLPCAAPPDQVAGLTEKLKRASHATGIVPTAIRADVVWEERFNRLTDANGSKGLALSRIACGLLRETWNPDDPRPTLFVGDKHGGRNRYDDLLAEILDGRLVFRGEEGRELSRYRVGYTELRFQTKGERHFPVAAASIIAKYLREVSMDLLNRFWQEKSPGLKPTRGYPEDARRFRQSIEPHCRALGWDERVWWRLR